jgi:hypothetical protein
VVCHPRLKVSFFLVHQQHTIAPILAYVLNSSVQTFTNINITDISHHDLPFIVGSQLFDLNRAKGWSENQKCQNKEDQ